MILNVSMLAAASACVQPTTTGPFGGDGFDASDIVVFYSCAAECNETTPPTPDNPMCFSHNLHEEGGWARFMSTRVWEDYQDGYRRYLLHLPFGSEWGNGAMDLDQPLDSIEAGEAHVMPDFFAALDWAETYMPEAEFIVYIGREETDLRETYDNDLRFHDHWHRVSGGGWNMVLLDYPNVSVAFDAGTEYRNGAHEPWSAGDPYFQFVKLFQSYKHEQRRKVYIEAIPRNSRSPNIDNPVTVEWQRTMPWISFEDDYLFQVRRWWNYDPPLETPEGIRCMIRDIDLDHWTDRGGAIAWAGHCIAHGHTPAINRRSTTYPWHALTAEQAAVVMTRNIE